MEENSSALNRIPNLSDENSKDKRIERLEIEINKIKEKLKEKEKTEGGD